MNDILPDDAELWEQFEETVRAWLGSYGYRPIRMPLVEPTPLFARAIGAVTDIVEKEMYSFRQPQWRAAHVAPGRHGQLRACRAPAQSAATTKRLWYHRQMFVMSGRKKVVTASFIRSGSRHWGLLARISMPNRS